MDFKLTSRYQPTGDQPEAIRQLTEGLRQGLPAQTLLGVTGSGKTFTMANVIQNFGRPTLILSHNKTLAAQLYGEMKQFFPENAVEYYVSYYDYYQPEAYIPSTDTYIEKDLAINEEIDRLRLSATSALLSGRNDVVVVSSVSCIYGMGNPAAFYDNVIDLAVGQTVTHNALLRRLLNSLYVRNDITPTRGSVRVKGDTVWTVRPWIQWPLFPTTASIRPTSSSRLPTSRKPPLPSSRKTSRIRWLISKASAKTLRHNVWRSASTTISR